MISTTSILQLICGFIALFILLGIGMTGCNPQISCWYSTYANNTFGPPAYYLKGRTVGILSTDVSGSIFQTKEDLDSYIESHHLKLCGQNP